MISEEKIIFIDRDGVINKDPGGWTKYNYVTDPRDFYFLPDVLSAIKMLTEYKYKIIIISNQAGVGKGHFSKADLDRVNDHMLKEVEMQGGKISGAYYCIHRKEENCDCRKPKTGLLEMAIRDFRTNVDNSYLIGDSLMDIEAGKSFGIKTILVLSGKTNAEELSGWDIKPDEIKRDLKEAVDFIIKEDNHG